MFKYTFYLLCLLSQKRDNIKSTHVPVEFGVKLTLLSKTNVNKMPRGLEKWISAACVPSTLCTGFRNKDSPVEMDRTLTHQRAEGDDSQESLDEDAEPLHQSSVVAAVGVRLVDVGHVGDFKRSTVQESFHQEDAAVAVHVHVDKIKTTAQPRRQKDHFLSEEEKHFTYSTTTNRRIFLCSGIELK